MTANPPPRKPSLNGPIPTGTNDTVAQFILRQIEAGSDIYSAAGAAGVPAPTLQTWMNEGRIQWTRATASSADWARDFTPDQQDLALFYVKATTTVDTNRSRGSILLEQHVRGGLTKTSVRRKRVNGDVVEEVETTETLLPNLQALMFKLERLHADVYGPTATLRLATVDLSDTPDVGRALEEAMAVVAKRMSAIEVGETHGDGDA